MTEEEIRNAVVAEMKESAQDVDAMTYAEVYDMDDDEIERASRWQARAIVIIAFREES